MCWCCCYFWNEVITEMPTSVKNISILWCELFFFLIHNNLMVIILAWKWRQRAQIHNTSRANVIPPHHVSYRNVKQSHCFPGRQNPKDLSTYFCVFLFFFSCRREIHGISSFLIFQFRSSHMNRLVFVGQPKTKTLITIEMEIMWWKNVD